MNGVLVSQVYDNESLLYNLKDVCVFYLNPSRPVLKIDLPLFNAMEAFNFDGTIVATNWETFTILKKVSKPIRKIFYVRELEWMKSQDFYENRVVHYDPSYEYVANGEYVQRCLKYWGINAKIVREVEFGKIFL